MTKPLLEFFAHTALIATFLGPIVLIWRFRAMGWLCSIFWFWLLLVIWSLLDYDLDWEKYRMTPQGAAPQYDEGPLVIMFSGWFLGLVYCSLLVVVMAMIEVVIRKLWK
jgi:hypothetical protein